MNGGVARAGPGRKSEMECEDNIEWILEKTGKLRKRKEAEKMGGTTRPARA